MATVKLSLITTGTGFDGNGFPTDISADGSLIVFDAAASPTDDALYAKEIGGGAAELIARSPRVVTAGVSETGIAGGFLSDNSRYLLYTTGGVVGPINSSLFLRDLQSGDAALDLTPGFTAPGLTNPFNVAFQRIDAGAVSSSGSVLLYTATVGDLFDEVPDVQRLYLQNLATNQRLVLTTLTKDTFGSVDLVPLDLSAAGDKVLYEKGDVYLYDVTRGVTVQITTGGGVSSNRALTADGRYVAYSSLADGHTYLRDFVNPFGLTDRRVDVSKSGVVSNGTSRVTSLSADGRYVAFLSDATNLIDGITLEPGGPIRLDLYVKDLVSGSVTLVARDVRGGLDFEAGNRSDGELSADGRRIVFSTEADHPELGDTDGQLDVYVADLIPPPAIDIISVATDNVINAVEASTQSIVSGTSDALGRFVTVTINGAIVGTAQVDAAGQWNAAIQVGPLPDGPLTVVATVTNTVGESGSDSQLAVLRRTPPEVEIQAVADDFVVNTTEARQPITVRGRSNAGGGTVELLLGATIAGRADVQNDGTWSTTFSLSGQAGNTVIGARLTDGFGNTGLDTDIVFIDRPAQPATFSLGSLDGSNGFRFSSSEPRIQSGLIGPAGDVNGDGIADGLLITFFDDNQPTPTVPPQPGSSGFVILGSTNGFPALLSSADLNGSNGFALTFPSTIDLGSLGQQAGSGDFNGDGLSDLLDGQGNVLFGRRGPGQSAVDLGTLNGSNGFSIRSTFTDVLNYLSPGDVNADGYDDLLVTAATASPNGIPEAGDNYLIFGRQTWSAVVDPLLDGSTTRIPGQAGLQFLRGISGLGDVNGDSVGDFIFFGIESGTSKAYVVFGKDTGLPATLSLSSLNGSNGFTISPRVLSDGFEGQFAAASGGDINGDGINDLVLTAPQADGDQDGINDVGETYIIFGRTGDWSPAVALNGLNGVNGFRVDGTLRQGASGQAVNASGDFDGDGFDDLVIGAPLRPELSDSPGYIYLLYGKRAGWASRISLADLDGANGFRIDGLEPGSGAGRSVAFLGDVNQDGYEDLGVVASAQEPGPGDAYVVFGRARGREERVTLSAITGDDRLTPEELAGQLPVQGTSTALGQTITLYLDGASIGSAVVDAAGFWSTSIDASGFTPGRFKLRATLNQSRGATASDGAILTVPGVVNGKVIDGPVSGATVFIDANGNHVADDDEQRTTSGADGGYSLLLEAQSIISSTGGTDTSTGLPTIGTLQGTSSFKALSPLTTLAVRMAQQQKLSVNSTVQALLRKLSTPASASDFTGFLFDDIANSFNGSDSKSSVYTSLVQVAGSAAIWSKVGAAVNGTTTSIEWNDYLTGLAGVVGQSDLERKLSVDVNTHNSEYAHSLKASASLQQKLGSLVSQIQCQLLGNCPPGAGGGGGLPGGALTSLTEGLTGFAYVRKVSAINLVAQGELADALVDAVNQNLRPSPLSAPGASELSAVALQDPLDRVLAAFTGQALIDRITAAERRLRDLDGAAIENAPFALPDGYELVGNTSLTVPAAGVLDNDWDPDGDTLSALLASGPENGSLTLNPDGSFTYTPIRGFSGVDRFSYIASDGKSPGVLSRASLLVTAPPFDPPPSVTIDQAPGQADPTGTGPIRFAVVFSEPVTGFEADDLVLSTTGTGTLLASVSGGGSSYEVNVTGFTSPGTITASIPGGAAVDSFGQASSASTSADNSVRVVGSGTNFLVGTSQGEILRGTATADVITPLEGNDLVLAGKGNDSIIATAAVRNSDGNDVYNGEGGTDTIDYSMLTQGVAIRLLESAGGVGIATGPQSGTDLLVSIEVVVGSSGPDQITGNRASTVVEAGPGDDTIVGGSGADVFVFRPGFGLDRIADFDADPSGGQDFIALRGFGITRATFDQRVRAIADGADTLLLIDRDPDQVIRLSDLADPALVTIDDVLLS